MRKTRKSRSILNFVLISILIIFMLSSVQAAIESIKNDYTTTEPVSVRSTSTPLCYNLPNNASVTLYIVENKDVWKGGDNLTDVRKQPQEIPNSQFVSKEVWSKPKTGFYDIIVDCDLDGTYGSNEPIDSFSGIGFTVTAVPGIGKAAIGERNIGSHSWMYDSEEPRLTNEMLQLSLTAEGEDIKLENITIQASGTGNDVEIDKLEIYVDENNNGKLDDGEALIGDLQPAYLGDNGLTTINLDSILTQDISQNILIVYQMKETTPVGDYSLSINSIYGTGESSGSLINFLGLPINSGIKTVLPEKSCFGSLVLEIEPNPAVEDSAVKAKISGLTGCQNKTVVLRTNPCGSSIQDKISSCILGTEGCEISFTALTSQTYHACVNKNEDNDMIDFGEYTLEDLIVNPKPQPKVNITSNITANITEEGVNITEEQKNVSGISGITGSIIEEFTKKISGAGTFLILLEITLLLIFVVLVVIAFRLKKPRIKEKAE